ncbi:conserved hypothetical protein [Haloferula helveola]|uniref:DUF58 domain-containing protein n=1 Tax=Haloferula helveola TaxID=490095 RepID=A0ABM7RHD1_9BACT|nr:conserved hypothetical protein [Haloferula helveola]
MTPTRRVLYLVFTWTLVGVGVSIWPDWQIAWWVVAGVLLLILGLDALMLGLSRMPVARREVPDRFALGEAGEVRIQLSNPGSSSIDVEVFDGIPEGAEAEAMPWRGRIRGREEAKIYHPVRLLERGVTSFREGHLRVRSILGLWWRKKAIFGDESVKVFPDYEPVVKFALLAMQARQEQMGIVRRSVAGSSRDFHQLREYREGDPLAQIDWKATSRRLSLISREFQEQRNQTIIFLTDTGRRMRAIDGELPQFDHCLNSMLLLSYVALRQGDQVGVQSFGGTDRWLPPVKGQHSMATLLNHLFDYQTTPEPSDFSMAAERLQARQRRRALVVVMTNLRGEDASEILPALRILASRHLVMLASLRERTIEDARRKPVEIFNEALKFSAAEQYDAERAEVLANLRGYGVLTLDVPAQELPVALANRYLDIKAAGRL